MAVTGVSNGEQNIEKGKENPCFSSRCGVGEAAGRSFTVVYTTVLGNLGGKAARGSSLGAAIDCSLYCMKGRGLSTWPYECPYW